MTDGKKPTELIEEAEVHFEAAKRAFERTRATRLIGGTEENRAAARVEAEGHLALGMLAVTIAQAKITGRMRA